MTIEELVRELEESFNKVYGQYYDAHNQFDTYRGVPPDKLDNDEVRHTVQIIQDSYRMLYPAFKFIREHNQRADIAMKGYTLWVEDTLGTMKKKAKAKKES